ncbi:MAG: LLM class F420-dependent oxidoreductase [Acidimicrobiia bacterium]
MRVGLFLPSVSPVGTPEFLTAYGTAAEDAGFASLWVGEHVVFVDEYSSKYPYSDDGRLGIPHDVGLLEPFATLSFLASATDRIRLGTAVCLVPQRNPVYTAKSVSTLDWLSGGRIDFGVGIGWLREEFEALNEPFERRAARTREYLAVIRTLWRDELSSYEGEMYQLPPCRMFPKPVQAGGPPIYFGGETDPALRRVAEIGDGWHGFNHLPDSAAASVKRLDGFLSDAGRSLDDIDITIGTYMQAVDLAHLSAYRDAGVNQLVLPAFAPDPDGVRTVIAELGDKFVGAAAAL